MKNTLFCYAAIFLIGSGAFRGCVRAARRVPQLFERVKPSRPIEEPIRPWSYGAKIVEGLDSANIEFNAPNRQINIPAPGCSPGIDSLSVHRQMEEMKRQINPSNTEGFQPLHRNHTDGK